MRNSNRPKSYNTRTYIQKAVITNRRVRRGDVSKISESTGYSTAYISDVMTGKTFNNRIMNKAFNMVRGRKENLELL